MCTWLCPSLLISVSIYPSVIFKGVKPMMTKRCTLDQLRGRTCWHMSDSDYTYTGVFQLMQTSAILPFERISTVPQGSQWRKWASPWMEQCEAERCKASKRSERCQRTIIASDQVVHSKRNRLVKKNMSSFYYSSIAFTNGYEHATPSVPSVYIRWLSDSIRGCVRR